MEAIKPNKTYKTSETAICNRQILFSRENSKLCFCLTEPVQSDKNAPCPSLTVRAVSSKVGNRLAINSPTNKKY